jgi:DNA-binding MarR family transcriptional regulator
MTKNRFDELAPVIYLLSNVMSDRIRNDLDLLCRKEHITIAQFPVLWTLYLSNTKDGLPMSEISDGLVTRASDTTRLVDRLVEAGLVSRSQSNEDRRKILINITKKGRTVFERVSPEIKLAHREQFSQLSESEMKQLIKLLNKVIWNTKGN